MAGKQLTKDDPPDFTFKQNAFSTNNGGSIPHNLLIASNTESNDEYMRHCRQNNLPIHPARFPTSLPDIMIRFLTEADHIVWDPFAGSGQANIFPFTLGTDSPFALQGPYIAIPPDIKTPRQQSWNATFERQIGDNVGVQHIETAIFAPLYAFALFLVWRLAGDLEPRVGDVVQAPNGTVRLRASPRRGGRLRAGRQRRAAGCHPGVRPAQLIETGRIRARCRRRRTSTAGLPRTRRRTTSRSSATGATSRGRAPTCARRR